MKPGNGGILYPMKPGNSGILYPMKPGNSGFLYPTLRCALPGTVTFAAHQQHGEGGGFFLPRLQPGYEAACKQHRFLLLQRRGRFRKPECRQSGGREGGVLILQADDLV